MIVSQGSSAGVAKINLWQLSPSEPQPRKHIRIIMALSSSFSLAPVEREQRIPVALGHLLTLTSVDLWPSALEEGLLIWIAMTVGKRNNNQCYTFKFIYACTALSTEPLSIIRILQRVQEIKR